MSLFNGKNNFEHTDASEHSDDHLEVSTPEIGEKFETEEESFENCQKVDTQENISENPEVDEKEDFEQIEKTQDIQTDTSVLDEESFEDAEKTEDDVNITDKNVDVIQTGEESPAKPFESEPVDGIKPAFATIEENEEETIEEEIIEEEIINEETAEKETLPEKERSEVTERSPEADLEKTTEQKIEDVRDVDGVSLSYLTELRNENTLKMDSEQQKYETQKQEAVDVYSQMIDGKTSPEKLAHLQERYQNLRQEIGDTRSRMEELESSSDMINEKLDRTRQGMIEDGIQACENTALEQTLANELHEEYNEIYYDEKASVEELKDLADRNKSLIDAMVSDRERIEGAKEAKMSQIRDYVSSNDMERYDTERDPAYRQMINEYRALEDQGKKLDYPIASLDEDTKLISERIGESYQSVQKAERTFPSVSECAHGTDDPEKTDYHPDEIKVEKALGPFADQEKWEQMEPEEKIKAIGDLRDYTAEIFGDTDKPEIVYYSGDKDSYGGYIPSANIIKININNIEDASETMDTVAHEYRHRYQQIRAEVLENTRDVDFKRGLDPDHYIVYDPDKGLNDYEGYRNQLVEADARAFALTYKERLEEIKKREDTSRT